MLAAESSSRGEPPSPQHRFAASTWFMLVAFCWLALFALTFDVLVARRLGPDRYGQLVPLLGLTDLVSVPLAVTGLIFPNVGSIGGSVSAAVSTRRATAGGMAIASIWAAASPVVAQLLHMHSVVPVALDSLWFVPAVAVMVSCGHLVARGKSGTALVSLIVGAVIRIMASLLLIGDGLGVTGAVLSGAIGALASLSISSTATTEGQIPDGLTPGPPLRHLVNSVTVASGLVAVGVVPAWLAERRYPVHLAGLFDGSLLIGQIALFLFLLMAIGLLRLARRRWTSEMRKGSAMLLLLIAAALVSTIALTRLASLALTKILLGSHFAASTGLLAKVGEAEMATGALAVLTLMAPTQGVWTLAPWCVLVAEVGLFLAFPGSIPSLGNDMQWAGWTIAAGMVIGLSRRWQAIPSARQTADWLMGPPGRFAGPLFSGLRREIGRRPIFADLTIVAGFSAVVLIAALSVARSRDTDVIAELIVILLIASILLGSIDTMLRRRDLLLGTVHSAPTSTPLHTPRLRAWIWGTATAVVAVLAVSTQFLGGGVIAGGDSPPPVGLAWIARLFSATAGQPDQLPWAIVEVVVSRLGGSAGLAQAVWISLLFAGASTGAFVLQRLLGISAPAAAVGGLAYIFNLYVVSEVGDNEVFLAALAVAPIVSTITLAVGLRRFSVRSGLALLAATAPLLGYVATNPPFLLLMVACAIGGFVVALLIAGSAARTPSLTLTLVGIPLMAALCAYWWLPGAIESGAVSGGSLGSLSSWGWTETRATLENDLWLNSNWAWVYPAYFPEEAAYSAFPLILLRFALPIVAFSALPIAFRHFHTVRLRRIALFSAAVAVFIIVFATGTLWPGSLIFNPLSRLPYGYLLREPGRYLMGAAIAYAVLVGIFFHYLFAGKARTWRRTAVRWSLGGVAIVAVLTPAYPTILGRLAQSNPSPPLKVPSYWTTMADYINHLGTPGALLLEPADDFYQMPYNWGYYGTDGFITQMISRSVIDPVAEGYVAASDELLVTASKVTSDLAAGEWEPTNALLGALGARFVLVRGDVDYQYQGRHLVPPDAITATLVHDPEAVLIRQAGPLALFEVTVPPGGPIYFDSVLNPNLSILGFLEPGARLVRGPLQAGNPGIVELPPFSRWSLSGGHIEISVALPKGFRYSGAIAGTWQGSVVDPLNPDQLGRFEISAGNEETVISFSTYASTGYAHLDSTAPVLIASPVTPASRKRVLLTSSAFQGNGWIGPPESVPTHVDGLYEGWFVQPGRSSRSVHYRWANVVRGANYLSIGAALIVLASLVPVWARRALRRRGVGPVRDRT